MQKELTRWTFALRIPLATILFRFIIGSREAKQYGLSLQLQLSGQTSNFVHYGSKMWAEVGLCKRWLGWKSAQFQ